MTKMIERVARKLAELDDVNPGWSATGVGMPGPEDNEPGWKLYEEDAAAMSEIERKALMYAARAHEAVGHRRKYTNEPYIVHPIAVAKIVKSVPHTPEMVAAALLHDTVEDTDVTRLDIIKRFDNPVADLVYWLTDVSKPSDGTREVRKAKDRAHIAEAPAAAQTIKLADLIDNTSSIKARDPDFWRVYRREKLLLLDVLDKGDRQLWERAMEQCQ